MNVTLTASGVDLITMTGTGGAFTFGSLEFGEYELKFSQYGYVTQTGAIIISASGSVIGETNIVLNAALQDVHFEVQNEQGGEINEPIITFSGSSLLGQDYSILSCQYENGQCILEGVEYGDLNNLLIYSVEESELYEGKTGVVVVSEIEENPIVILTTKEVNTPPVAYEQVVELYPNQTKEITLIASDDNGDDLTYQIISTTGSGSLVGSGSTFVYAPDQDFIGEDSFTFQVFDGQDNSNIATVNITVLDLPTYQISGVVTNTGGNILEGAQIEVVETGQTVLTGSG